MKVTEYASIFYRKAQDLTLPGNFNPQAPTPPGTPTPPGQSLSPQSIQQAKNTAIFLVKNTEPLGPLEWLEKYVGDQVKQAQAAKNTNPLPIATQTALTAAKNLKMAGRNLVTIMENATFNLQAAKSAFATVQTQFTGFDNQYLKSWILAPQYAQNEGKQYRKLTDALKVLSNLLK